MSEKPHSCKDYSYGRADRGEHLPRAGSMQRWNYEYGEETKQNGFTADEYIRPSIPKYQKLCHDISCFLFWKRFSYIVFFASIFILGFTCIFSQKLIYLYVLSSVAVVGIIAFILVVILIHFNLEYSFDEQSKEQFQRMNKALASLASCDKLWEIYSSTSVTYEKVMGGATHTIERGEITLSKENVPYFLKSDVDFFAFKLSIGTFIFLPDAFLAISGIKATVFPYSALRVSSRESGFREEDELPDDAEKIGETWEYVNKNGTPDHRFNNNFLLPIMRYLDLTFSCGGGTFFTVSASSFTKAKFFLSNFKAGNH